MRVLGHQGAADERHICFHLEVPLVGIHEGSRPLHWLNRDNGHARSQLDFDQGSRRVLVLQNRCPIEAHRQLLRFRLPAKVGFVKQLQLYAAVLQVTLGQCFASKRHSCAIFCHKGQLSNSMCLHELCCHPQARMFVHQLMTMRLPSNGDGKELTRLIHLHCNEPRLPLHLPVTLRQLCCQRISTNAILLHGKGAVPNRAGSLQRLSVLLGLLATLLGMDCNDHCLNLRSRRPKERTAATLAKPNLSCT
mmetsp:Transcript_29642/g.68286  ORF Transcript_29642/g.68286 Transcript_29642/m.68286 type:complete len:249 (+) Transcript_29642:583-1329(+)